MVKFFDRTLELDILRKALSTTQRVGSQMTVVTGRRRVGKTKLIQEACKGELFVYWFVSRSDEGSLTAECARRAVEKLGIFVPEGLRSFADLFELVMQEGRHRTFTLVIDEFQEFFYINSSVFSRMQDVWDRYKDETHVNLVISGSVYTLMKRIFRDAREPLYGRATRICHVKPFTTDVLSEILGVYKPGFANEDLLALYAFTGGVPKYVELLMDAGCTDRDSMIDFITTPDSVFLDEGKSLLVTEFGREYGVYFSILSAVASGKATTGEIQSDMAISTIAGQLKRLEEDYELVEKKRPILAKPASKTVRYALKDQFLKFWFAFIYRHRQCIETGQPQIIGDKIKEGYNDWSGLILEDYFRARLRESGEYTEVSAWWQVKNSDPQSEIDIVALHKDGKRAFVAEVKRQKKQFKKGLFLDKVEILKTKELNRYVLDPQPCCLTLDDMTK